MTFITSFIFHQLAHLSWSRSKENIFVIQFIRYILSRKDNPMFKQYCFSCYLDCTVWFFVWRCVYLVSRWIFFFYFLFKS